jgi:hypothetical protein
VISSCSKLRQWRSTSIIHFARQMHSFCSDRAWLSTSPPLGLRYSAKNLLPPSYCFRTETTLALDAAPGQILERCPRYFSSFFICDNNFSVAIIHRPIFHSLDLGLKVMSSLTERLIARTIVNHPVALKNLTNL